MFRSTKLSVSTDINMKRMEFVLNSEWSTFLYWFGRKCQMAGRRIWQSWEVRAHAISFEPGFGTAATAKADLLEPQHQHIIGSKADSKCVSQMMSSLLTVILRQILNEAPKTLEKWDVQDFPRAYLKPAKQLCAILQKNVCLALKDLTVVPSFLYHITLYLSQNHLDLDLFQSPKYLPSTIWSEQWHSPINCFHDRSLLPH